MTVVMLYAPPGYLPDPNNEGAKGSSMLRLAPSFSRAADILSGKWNLPILHVLQHGPRRFAELHSALPGISPNILISKLRDLGAAGVVFRRNIPPPANCWVYELTNVGELLSPILRDIARWGDTLPPPEPNAGL